MKLTDIKGTYDGIFSLGELCNNSIQLERNGLRPFSGVLDWVGSPVLSDVSRLLRNRFAGFMDRNHLKCIGNAGEKLYLVHEQFYNIYSNHDFFVHQNDPERLEYYPQVKMKYDRRAARLLDKLATGNRLLFIRESGTYDEVVELQQVLSDLTTNEFVLLFINPGPVTEMTELDWPLEHVCAVNMPPSEKLWNDCDHMFKQIFHGIEYDDD